MSGVGITLPGAPAGGGVSSKLWLSWEDDSSIRSRVLAEELGANYRAFTFLSNSRVFRWLRYPVVMVQTAWLLLWRRPDIVIAQNPSVVLAWEAAVLKKVLCYRLVVDLHTHFVNPTGLAKRAYDLFHGYSLRNCDVVIVTNDAYRRIVAERTPKPVLILPDKVPELEEPREAVSLGGTHNVLYICTYSEDEPWSEVLAAAELLDGDVHIYMSGRSPLRQEDVPDNVFLTGFLPRRDYQNLLQSVDAVMVLTTAEDNLVCGGYEAVAAGKPLILSETRALRDFFERGTVFTENRRTRIARAIRMARAEAPRLTKEIRSLRDDLEVVWNRRWQDLVAKIEDAV